MTNHFSQDYRSARNLILTATKDKNWAHQAYQHPLNGVDGEPIFTDVFRKGPQNASRVLVLNSATHGVEGYCGSALQHQFICDDHALPDDFAVLLIHGINPFGFSHWRRVTEDNVDLNRNFIDFENGSPTNEAYADIDSLLNPTEMPDGHIDTLMQGVKKLQDDLDYLTFMKTVSGGQYDFPAGMQYGGQAPTWSRQTVEKIWATALSDAKTVLQIDIHTGLGPKALGMLMMAANEDEPHHALMQEWFGIMLITPRPATAEDVIMGGYLNGGLEQALPNTRVMPMTLEYGTEPAETVMQAMIEDNWLCNHDDINTPKGQAIKERVLRAFYPDDLDWNEKILTRGREVFGQAIAGLQTQ